MRSSAPGRSRDSVACCPRTTRVRCSLSARGRRRRSLSGSREIPWRVSRNSSIADQEEFATMAKRSDASVDRGYQWSMYLKLPPINGYAETFSVFQGETVHIRAARKLDFAPLAWLTPLRVRSIELRDAVSEATVAVPAEPTRLYKQIPKSYRDKGAAYRARIAIDTTNIEPGLYECIVRDN